MKKKELAKILITRIRCIDNHIGDNSPEALLAIAEAAKVLDSMGVLLVPGIGAP